MSLNSTPIANRMHIGIYGRRNAGKSSLINALTGQHSAIVSDVAGTTTDPVYKAMELLPIGPVVFIDTAGLDDESALERQRVQKSLQTLDAVDIALLVLDGPQALGEEERHLIGLFASKDIRCLRVRNKLDRYRPATNQDDDAIWVSAATGENIQLLRERIAHLAPIDVPALPIVADLLQPNDMVLLVVPIDSAAPKGRLILPQQQTIRDILDAGAQAIITREDALADTMKRLMTPPRLVIVDSQAFEQAAAVIPADIPMTSFSILFARHKGVLRQAVLGANTLDTLQDGDRVLISEGCTHQRQCEDIGTVKLPHWMGQYTGKQLQFDFTSGGTFPKDLSLYRLVVHCGACMLPRRTMRNRLATALQQQIPMTNYGILIAKMKGILQRSIAPFAQAGNGWDCLEQE